MGALDGGKDNQEMTRPSLEAYLLLDMSQNYICRWGKRKLGLSIHSRNP